MANYCIMETGYLKVILGSMFSGKTTELIKEYHRYNACGFKCCFINHSYDKKRFNSETNTQAHNNLTVKTDFYIDKLSKQMINSLNLILIHIKHYSIS